MKWQVSKIWSGVCWIIGGGSSVREQFNIPDNLIPETKEEFKEFGDYLSPIHKDHIIGVNLAAFLGDWVDVAFWGDTSTYLDYKGWFDEFAGLKVSVGSKFYAQRYKSIKFLHRNHDDGITTNKAELSWVGKNSGSSAINLAYHLGCTEIRLLGFDMKNHESGRMHFHTGYPKRDYIITNKDAKKGNIIIPRREPKDPYKKKFLPAFEKIAQDAKKLGIKIINVSPYSEIKEFPKMSLEDVLGEKYTLVENEPKKESKINNKTIEIRCVLKSGGVYTPNYVKTLKKAIQANTNHNINFVCLSDIDLDFCETIKLKHDWPGWWSKIELFRPDLKKVPSVYFDLDTIVTGNIDNFLDLSIAHKFLALRGFNHKFKKQKSMNFASGLMMGSFYKYTNVYNEFKLNPDKHINEPRKNWMHGDQGFIADIIGLDSIPRLQDFLHEDYIIGKKLVNKMGNVSKEARIIAWSGNPRLADLAKYDNHIYKIINQMWKKYE